MDDELRYAPLAAAALYRLPTHDEYMGWNRAITILKEILILDPPYTEDGRRILLQLLEKRIMDCTLYCKSHIEK